MSFENLKLLETKVGEFLTAHEAVQRNCTELRQQVKDQEKQLAEATARLKQYEKERDEVRARLDRVLKRFEGLNLK